MDMLPEKLHAAITCSTNTKLIAMELSSRLSLPLIESPVTDYPYLLGVTEKHLELQRVTPSPLGPIFVDFSDASLLYRLKHGGGIKQTLAKACGLKPGLRPEILDVTAGLGKDAFVLASLGCTVTLMERSPIIAALLEDGLNRAMNDSRTAAAASRMILVTGNSIELMKKFSDGNCPQTIYLDPMFPYRTKSALVKKEMRILREIAGYDSDAPELLETAIKTARQRVVIKRPKAAPPIEGPAPSLSTKSQNHRYDIYLR
ncbi:MAG: class I SAM-dependent methyltransferase [Proteobacteria bacterium]|nr:class I SAM-dependent methyltransferase [Pseudomonadota bacterium]MBU1708682.1 class I SAM-dependent methyltransferase [Pseudomonadota bacterium]